MDRFADLVWSICRAQRMSDEDAADAAQLTWLRLLQNLERIRDPRRRPAGSLPPAAASAWL